ncbi:MAG: hypothetical protein RLZZ524_2607 [Pseudomonadota bacterium]
MSPLPLDEARCPGAALLDMITLRAHTDMRCHGCARLLQAQQDVAQWKLDGCPRVDGGKPRLAGAWITPPDRDQWHAGICPQRLEASK